jgi:hypothetical protein
MSAAVVGHAVMQVLLHMCYGAVADAAAATMDS